MRVPKTVEWLACRLLTWHWSSVDGPQRGLASPSWDAAHHADLPAGPPFQSILTSNRPQACRKAVSTCWGFGALANTNPR